MPQSVVPSSFFLRNGHLKTNSQHAPQRLHSPRRKANEAIVSCLRKFVLTNRLIFPCACRARSFASAILRDLIRFASRSSNERCFERLLIFVWLRSAPPRNSSTDYADYTDCFQ